MNEGNIMSFGCHPGRVVVIVTGGAFPAGRRVARELARWAWPVVIVYLDHQSQACGVPEVGPGSLTSGDRWSDMIRACHCGYCT
jgi:NAD(P)-dependent dehydrogenase (short-subunit alcohol dehydrogenase family)